MEERSIYAYETGAIPELSEEETSQLIEMLSTEKREYAKAKLIKHNMKLVLLLAFKYRTQIYQPLDDIISMGMIGLASAVENFDNSKNFKLSTFIYKCVDNVYKGHIFVTGRRSKWNVNFTSLNDVIHVDKNGEELTLVDAIAVYDEEEIFDLAKRAELLKVLSFLNEKDQKVLMYKYGFIDGVEHTYDEIAEIMNVSRQRVSHRGLKAMEKLRDPKILKKILDIYE